MTDDTAPSDPQPTAKDSRAARPGGRGGRQNKRLLFVLKLLFSIAMLTWIVRKILGRDGADGFAEVFDGLSLGVFGAWFAAAVLMQLIAVAFSTVRWQRLLVGQGIVAGWRFLAGSMLIARFWGAFTPGGFTGFGGWRIYDVHKHTGKTARATATIGVEMILGQLAFGVVVMAGSLFGMVFIGVNGVLLVNGFFVVLIAVGLTFLARPALIQSCARWLPPAVQVRVQTLVDAVCTYRGKANLLVQAAALGMGTHAFNNLIYVCAAQALGVELGVGEVFFGSSLQIFSTLLPASINGIGLREATAVALYTRVGVPPAVALLIPIVGFTAEMLVSSVGGLIFVARRSGYDPKLEVLDIDREETAHEAIVEVPEAERPAWRRGLWLGLGAGLLGGMIVGVGEAAVILATSAGGASMTALPYGAVAYGLLGGCMGATLGLALALAGRFMKRAAMGEPAAYARMAGFLAALLGLALTAFRVRRDLFDEELVWRSPTGALVLAACIAAAGLAYVAIAALLRRLLARDRAQVMLRPWATPAVLAAVGLVLVVGTFAAGPHVHADTDGVRGVAPEGAGDVILIVVDTLRADHLPSYGYRAGSTPHLDAFAEDAVRFDQAFVNSSWTRPSFASILTGRFASSHGTMAKSAALPGELVTLAEALRAGGYATGGFVTNYNVAPYFNFHQGFDYYRYIEPDFVLGADDTAAKLLVMQFARQRLERFRAVRGTVLEGTAYQDAEVINGEVSQWLDGAPATPWFLFIGYMDPHDPYFEHPYDGRGYGRAAHYVPDPEEADELRRLYDGEITFWDEHFGRLMAELRERGLYDDATIVVTSDHGEEFADHGGFWHGTTLYDEQLHVPLFVKLPQGRRAGTTVGHWVQSVDLMPTIVALVGVETPDGVQGGDLFAGTDIVYAEQNHEGNVLESVRERDGTDEHKLITANPRNPRGLPALQLFDVIEDPTEQHDLAHAETARVRALATTLVAAEQRARTGAAEAQAVDVDEAAAARLRALGYAGDE